MKLAYVDTSVLVAIAFGEPGHERLSGQLRGFDRLFSSNLLEAEFRATLAREAVGQDAERLLSPITWIFPERELTEEFREILSHGILRGADLWHLACALYLSKAVGSLLFSTLDERQNNVADALGMLSSTAS